MYVLGTVAILAAIPIENINLVEGLVNTFKQLFGASELGVMVTIVLFSYGAIAGSNEDLFWSLFAASAVLFVLPFVIGSGASIALGEVAIWYSEHERRKSSLAS